MEAIYGSNGAVVAWLWENERIYDLRGAVIGRTFELSEEMSAVYGLRGQHLGWLSNGLFMDHVGAVPGFLAGATGGPAKPPRQPRPPRPARQPAPPRPVRQPRIPRSARQSAWSAMDFTAFMNGVK